MKVLLVGIVVFAALFGLGFFISLVKIKADATEKIDVPKTPGELEGWLATQEAPFANVLKSAELKKAIVWNDPRTRARTKFAIVYLHGFSASRGEIRPVVETLAASLKANVFFQRLAGHGMKDGKALVEADPNQWIRETREAVEVGKAIGERVVLIGTSTGATLGSYLLCNYPKEVALAIFLSANYRLKNPVANTFDSLSGWLVGVAATGGQRSWTPGNEKQALYWNSSYPIRALANTVALTKYVRNHCSLEKVETPTLFLYTKKDPTIDPNMVEKIFDRWGAVRKKLVEISSEKHVFVGEANGSENDGKVLAEMERFIAEN